MGTKEGELIIMCVHEEPAAGCLSCLAKLALESMDPGPQPSLKKLRATKPAFPRVSGKWSYKADDVSKA